ncbi:MAG: anti-sigma factor [Flavobacteriaceae bacterium]|nr:anti-sigma factor [Flavobacteriaceae bacterium]
MNTKNYIASGMIEGYLFGLANADERLEFEQMLKVDAELRAEYEKVQDSLLNYMKSNQRKLPEGMKEKLWEKLSGTAQMGEGHRLNLVESAEQMVMKRAPIIVRLMPFAVAASLALFSMSAYMAWDYHKKWLRSENKIAGLEKEKNQVADQLKPLQSKLDDANNDLDHLNHQGIKLVRMHGKGISPESSALVCWDTKAKTVCLYDMKMPAAPSGKQYQLWAIVDGKPVNVSMIDFAKVDKKHNSYSMNNIKIENASAFAVTLENEGGAEVPTMEALYMMGGI